MRRGGANDAGPRLVEASLTSDDGWAAADGALRVLRAARDAGARRVVLTSSFAAVGYSPAPGSERTAWDVVEREDGGTGSPGRRPAAG